MRSALPLLTAFALTACATLPAPIAGGNVRQDGRALLGQPTRIGALVVTPRAVVEDSRCPINARCVWAGRVVLTTQVAGPGWRETRNLTLGQPVLTHGVTLALTSVEPGKMAGAQPQPDRPTLFGFEGGR